MNQYEIDPFLRSLKLVVEEARKAQGRGDNPELVKVGKVANAALLWHEADKAKNFDLAGKYLALVP